LTADNACSICEGEWGMYGGGVRTRRSVWQWIDESESKGAFGCLYIEEPALEMQLQRIWLPTPLHGSLDLAL
jgi:hypothetical protein